jgi:hypothetical protein
MDEPSESLAYEVEMEAGEENEFATPGSQER